MKVLLSLGSNLGGDINEVSNNISTAIKNINANDGVTVIKSSSFYTTKAWGLTDQPDFVNSALEIETQFNVESLFLFLQSIEDEMGRLESYKWGPRLIDIDILFCDDQIVNTDKLTIPHPLMEERRFVLEPLCEVAPSKIHPVKKKTVLELFKDCTDQTQVTVLSPCPEGIF